MSQYFTIVNETRQEYITSKHSPPDALGTLTDPIGTGMLAYLLLEGPQDGTRFTELVNPHAPELEDEMSDMRAEHREQYRNEGITSPYRNNDGSWNKQRAAKTIAAGWDINEANDYAGRWAGDTIRVTGDYAESGLYHEATQETWTYETRDGETFETHASGEAPIVPESLERTDIKHSILEHDPVPGDLACIRHPDTDERVYAEIIEMDEGEYTDITDQVEREYTQFVGGDWVEAHKDDSRVRVDFVLVEDEDGNRSILAGDETVEPINPNTTEQTSLGTW